MLSDFNKILFKEGVIMNNATFMSVGEVCEALGVSEAFAYKVIKKFNQELEAKGYFTVSGRVNREYFNERTYYHGTKEKGDADDAGLQG